MVVELNAETLFNKLGFLKNNNSERLEYAKDTFGHREGAICFYEENNEWHIEYVGSAKFPESTAFHLAIKQQLKELKRKGQAK